MAPVTESDLLILALYFHFVKQKISFILLRNNLILTANSSYPTVITNTEGTFPYVKCPFQGSFLS